MDPALLFFIGLKILILIFAVKIAKRKNRSAILWFFICLFSSAIGFLILVVLPPKLFDCPSCGSAYKLNQKTCDKCHERLPDRYESERIGLSNHQHSAFDHKCTNCNMPYKLEDYNENAEKIYCSRCKYELNKKV